MMSTRSRRWALGAALFLQALAVAACAGLGGNVGSVEADQLKMKGTLRTTVGAAFTVHEITSPAGTVVREYVAPSGVVFAVAWRGPKMPDLQTTLGTYFNQFTAAPRPEHPNHAHFSVNQPNFVLQSSGHMRAYSGRAYDPSLLPQGVAVTDIQ
jgi:Protein of unknown function (DUF2844)